MIIGGKHITGPAGHYPAQLAKEIVLGIEEEFDVSMRSNDVLAVEDADENGEEPELLPEAVNVSDSSGDEQVTATGAPKVSAAVRQAVSRLHTNTGHLSNRRLARALVIAGAPAEVVQAAKTLSVPYVLSERNPKLSVLRVCRHPKMLETKCMWICLNCLLFMTIGSMWLTPLTS